MSHQSKHQAIFDALHLEIIQHKHTPGGLLPSENALCRRWKVSRPTVARALKDLQILGLIERHAGSGTYVRPNIRATSPVLGLFVEGLGKTEILDPICAEITRAAQERGCGIFTGGLPADHSPREIAEEWAKNGIRGVFFAPIEFHKGRETYNVEVARAFEKAGLSVVLIDRDVTEYPRRSDYDLVAMDNFQAGCLLGLHLTGSGSKRVAFVAKPEYPATTDLRLAGVREGVRRNGNAKVDFHVGNPQEISFVEKVLRAKSRYDAVICSNDLTAAQWLQSATQKGWRVPADFKLAGFDDVHYATLLSVPLTTVRQPCRAIGIASVDAMQSRLERPLLPARNITLRGELVARASTESASSPSIAKQ
jgi:LacI family transcriptional regulator